MQSGHREHMGGAGKAEIVHRFIIQVGNVPKKDADEHPSRFFPACEEDRSLHRPPQGVEPSKGREPALSRDFRLALF